MTTTRTFSATPARAPYPSDMSELQYALVQMYRNADNWTYAMHRAHVLDILR